MAGDILLYRFDGRLSDCSYFRFIKLTPIRSHVACGICLYVISHKLEAEQTLIIHWLIVVMLPVVILSGCQRDKPPATEQFFKIGVVFPFSLNDCTTGSDLRLGVELALDIVNQEFDLPLPLAPGKGLTRHGGTKLHAIYRDSNFDPTTAAKAVDELIMHEEVKVLIGGYTSAESIAMSEQTETLRIPFLNCTSTAPRLTQRGFQWFFRITPNDTFYVHNFFQFLQNIQDNQTGSITRRLILVYENGPWGTGVAQVGRKFAKKYGYEIIAEIPYHTKENSLEKTLATKRHFFLPETIILQASYGQETNALLNGYKSMGIQPAAILNMNPGLINSGFIRKLGSHVENLLSQGVWSNDVSTRKPLGSQLNDIFKQRYGRDLSSNSARSFTGAMVLADALNRASSLTPKAIREALLQTDIPAEQLIVPWEGIKFEPHTGQNSLAGGFIIQIQQGESRTVWPQDIATSQLIRPVFPHPDPEAQQ